MNRPSGSLGSLFLLAGLVALLALPACGGGGGGTSAATTSSFVIVSSVPASGSQAVLLDSTVDVTFSEELDPASVSTTSLIVGEIGGFGTISGTATILADGTGRTLRWTGSDFLRPDAPHNCRVDGQLRSIGGNPISGGLQFQFRTVGGAPPQPLPDPLQMQPTVGTLNTGRSSHTATLLVSGQVLVAGGFSAGNSVTDRAELFAPSTQTFTNLTNRLQQERAGHTATRLPDGRVLLCGGWIQNGIDDITTTDTAEIYNPGTGTFTLVGDMVRERVDHAANLLPDGRVLITGGSRLIGNFLEDQDTAEIFDPTTNTFSLLAAPMVHTRATHEAAWTLGNRLILGGGSDVDFRSGRYDAITQTFTDIGQGAAINTRFGCRVVSFASGGVVIIGGDSLGTVEYVFPVTEVIVNSGSGLSRPRSYATATRYRDDAILVAGGIDFSNNAFVQASCDVIIEGGVGGSRTFETQVRLGTGMARHTATLLGDGRILLCGGINETFGQANKSASFLFTP